MLNTTQAAPFWSPAPESAGIPDDDACCMRTACRLGREADLEACFAGSFCSQEHAALFRFTDKVALAQKELGGILFLSIR